MSQADAAIIGVGCRLSGARTVDELWRQLAAGPARFPPLPSERWDPSAFGPPPRARLVDDYEVDFRAFRIPPAQLARMHRMERATMAALRDALLDAGLGQPGEWGARTAVHMAATTLGFDPAVDHLARVRLPETERALRTAGATLPPVALAAALRALDEAAPPISVDSLMTTAAMTAGRLANAFDLGAGHFAHDAGAASALAALAAASAALAARECDVAVVGALSPLLAATVVEAYRRRGLLSAQDCLQPFAHDAGTLLGEGALALVLMRESDARSQARRIRAVVRGLGQASIGRQGVAVGAEAAIARAGRQALAGAHFDPASVDYVECQAAGLGVVDESEQRALAAIFGGARPRPLGVATAAPAFGFLGAAAGLLGVVTATLALERGERPGGDARLWVAPFDGPDSRPLRLRAGALEGLRRAAVSVPGHGAVVHYAVLARADDRQPRAAPPRLPAARWGDRRVAIVGVGAVMPGAPDARALWRGVLEGRDAIDHIPPARWDAGLFLDAATRGVPGAVRATLAGLLPALRADAARLRLPPVSARQLDGAVLLTVDACAEALEDAGYRPGAWDARRVGVIVGHLPLREREYEAERRALAARSRARVEEVLAAAGVAGDRAAAVGSAFYAQLTQALAPASEETLEQLSSLGCATRVAALWDFRGGAQAVDAACASSLVALHLGTAALLRGELDAVVVAAAAYNLFPEYYVALATLGALGAGGSRPFDPDADGFVPAEGAGAVVLRRAGDAEREGHRVYALIAGSACSSDGRGTALLAPNSRGQQRALARAYRVAQVAPASIDLLEAHGTGTRAGDSVELETYGALYAERDRARPIALGSIKSNVGHLSSAAGMAGLIKTALALHERTLPPMRHRGMLHADHHALHDGPLAIAATARPWPAPPAGEPRRAGVSAFGLGGINAHVVLEERVIVERRESPPSAPRSDEPPWAPRAQRLRVELVPVARPAPSLRSAGALLLLGDPAGRNGAALAAALERAGWSLVRWNPAPGLSAAELDAELAGRVTPELVGAVDAVELDGAPPTATIDAVLATTRRAFATARALWPRWDARAARAAGGGDASGIHLVLTAMGGGLGFMSGARVGNGGALTGFIKGLKQERPALLARAIDFDAQEEADFIADSVVGELAAGGDRIEVGYFTRRRLVPLLRPAPLSPPPARSTSMGEPGDAGESAHQAESALAVAPGAVVVFSGGGRGVVLECARALAERGAICIVSGRTPRPRGDELGVELDDVAFEQLRRDELLARRRRDPTLTPVRFARQWSAVASTRALARNLAAAGDALEYVVADVADDAACAALLQGVRARHGRIDGIVHGAMVEESRALPDKSAALVDATLRVKVGGLMSLLTHSERDPLRFFVAFGSIAGRLGNRGQADYCAANDAMAKLLAEAAAGRPSTRCVTLDWSAWSDVGAAAEVATAARLERAGVEPITPAEGRRWFVEELAQGGHGDHELLVCAERQVDRWPFASHVRDGAALPPTEVDDRGQPLCQADWPLCDTLLLSPGAHGQPAAHAQPGRLLCERTFDERRDLYLRQHRLDGVAILPGAFAVELLAEVARLAVPGGAIAAVRDFVIAAPLKLPPGASPLVHTEAHPSERRADRADGELVCVDVAAGAARSLRERPYCRATIALHPSERASGKRPAALPAAPPLPPPSGRRPSRFDGLVAPVSLGPTFRLVEWIARSERGVIGQLRPPDEHGLFAFTAAPRFAVDPLLLDGAFQVAGNWDAAGADGFIAIPLGFGALRLHAPRPPGSAALVHAEVAEVRGRDVFYDVVVRAEGVVLFELTRLQLRRLEAVPE